MAMIENWQYEKGPWNNEPNDLQWQYNGYTCQIRRGPLGALCGYVMITDTHPLFGKHYNVIEDEIRCHGGLTYSRLESDNLWVIGFDCCHAGDLVPYFPTNNYFDSIYRDINYVKVQCESIVDQISNRLKWLILVGAPGLKDEEEM